MRPALISVPLARIACLMFQPDLAITDSAEAAQSSERLQEHLGFTSRTESFQRLQNSLTETFIQPGGVRIEHYVP